MSAVRSASTRHHGFEIELGFELQGGSVWASHGRKPKAGIPHQVARWQALASRADAVLFVNKKIAFIPTTGKQGRAQALGSTLVAIGEQGVAALETAHRNGLGRLMRPLRSQLEAAD